MRELYRLIFLPGFLLIILAVSSCQGFDEQLMYNKAQRLHTDGKIDEAIEIYRKLLEADPDNKIHPDNGIITYDLGVAYIDIGRRREAFEVVKELRRLKRPDLAATLESLLKQSEI